MSTAIYEPSARDMSIYYEVRLLHRTQVEVAERFGMSQGRVSQIVGEVRRWRASAAPDEWQAMGPDEEGDTAEERRQRVVEWECRQRTEMMLGWAIEDYHASRKPTVTTKSGSRGGVAHHETTVKEQRANAQILKTMVKMNGELRKEGRSKPGRPAKPAARAQSTNPRTQPEAAPSAPAAQPPGKPWEEQAAQVLLAKVESGKMTVDQADEYAIVYSQARDIRIARLWAGYEGDPARDIETPPANSLLMNWPSENPLLAYGRFFATSSQGTRCAPFPPSRRAPVADEPREKSAGIINAGAVVYGAMSGGW